MRRRVRDNDFCNECRCVVGFWNRAGRSLAPAEARKRAPQAPPETTTLHTKYPIATNSAADWYGQLTATQVGNRNCCPVAGKARIANPALAGRAEAPPRRGSQNSPRGLRHENICATGRPRRTKSRCRYLCRTKTVSWLRLAQLCELRNRRTRKTGAKKPPDTTNNSLNPLRHYAASGLLNLHAPRWYKP